MVPTLFVFDIDCAVSIGQEKHVVAGFVLFDDLFFGDRETRA